MCDVCSKYYSNNLITYCNLNVSGISIRLENECIIKLDLCDECMLKLFNFLNSIDNDFIKKEGSNK